MECIDGTPLLPLDEVLEALTNICEYSYESGYPEIGYDPVHEIKRIYDAKKG